MSPKLQELIDDAREELRAWWYEQGGNDSPYPEDYISEIADAAVPVYYSDLRELIDENPGFDEPGEHGLGTANWDDPNNPSPEGYAAINTYDAIYNALSQELYDLKQAADEELPPGKHATPETFESAVDHVLKR